MTINSLEGADWEGYEYFLLHFSKGTNTIVGKSHSGKSSIVRALNWVMENRPQGTSYFPHSKKKKAFTELSVEFDNGGIVRTRNSDINEYTIDSKDRYTALKTGVPEEVRKKSDMTSVNIQSQKDVHFFLTESPGKRAKILNEVANLEEMDKAMEIINKRFAGMSTVYDLKTKELEGNKKKLADLKWVSAAEKESNILAEMEKDLELLGERYSKIDLLKNDVDTLIDQIESLPNTEALPEIEALLDIDTEMVILERKESKLIEVRDSLQILILKEKDITLPDKDQLTKLEAISTQINDNKDRISALSELRQYIINLEDMEIKNDKIISGVQKNFYDKLSELGICPLCGAKEGYGISSIG